jgi:hypothetical protein
MAAENLSSVRPVARPSEPVEGTVGEDGLTEAAVGTVVVLLREDVAASAPKFAGNSLAPQSRVAGESMADILIWSVPSARFLYTYVQNEIN